MTNSAGFWQWHVSYGKLLSQAKHDNSLQTDCCHDNSLQTDCCHQVTLNLSTTCVGRARRGQRDKRGTDRNKTCRKSTCKLRRHLTLRLLMSHTHIYIYIYIYMERLFLMFLDHTQRRSKVGRTPLDE